MGKKIDTSGHIKPVSVPDADGKTRILYYLTMSADQKMERKKIRRHYETYEQAEKAYMIETGLRDPHKAHLFKLPSRLLGIVAEKYACLQDHPEHVCKSFDWFKALDDAIADHVWKCDVVTLKSLMDEVIKEQLQLEKQAGATSKKGYIGVLKWAIRKLYDDEQGRFSEDTNIKTIDVTVLNDLFLGYYGEISHSTHCTLHQNLSIIFNRAVAWRFLKVSPMEAVKMPPRDKTHEVIIHSVAQAQAILWTAWDYCPRLIPYLYFCYFGGSSPTETKKLTWESLNLALAQFHIGKGVTKATRVVLERDVDFFNPEQASRFLTPFANATGPILAFDYADDLRRVREMAIRVYGIEIPQWYGSIMRRTWMSHLYHTNRLTIDGVKRLSGHHKDSDVTFLHYIAYVSLTNALSYFEIMPPDRQPGTQTFPPRLLQAISAASKSAHANSSVKQKQNGKK